MKEGIDAMIAQYGQENAPPPWATFTMTNDIKEGNMHVVQKVFEGPFEVSWCSQAVVDLFADLHRSLTLYILQRRPIEKSRVSHLRSFLRVNH